MSRILVIGGYGGFGAAISERLAERGHQVLVAGRSADKASAFCAGRPGLIPAVADRSRLGATLADLAPDLVVDAAGPFQGANLAVPEACLATRIPYLDIADARDFVTGIARLDASAREAGIALVSGASSVPALSGAVVRHLIAPLDTASAVEIAISASSRATVGASVAAAILSYAGKAVPVWRGKAWRTGHGWQDMRRQDFEVSGSAPLRRRLVALCDVPDLVLLPDRLPGRPAVAFHAGTELAFQNLALWLASWPVRWRLLASLSPLGRLLEPARRLTARLGGDRSAMTVRLFGKCGEARVERRWTLLAERGDGPRIPALAVPVLADRILAGAIPPGAADAGTLLDLANFEPEFARLAVRHETIEIAQPPPLYRRVMGARFDALPASVRAMHGVLRDEGAHGEATVTRGRNPIARLICRLVRFPPAGAHPIHVHFAETDGVETWTRHFSGHRFHSRLSQRGAMVVERFGAIRFGFTLPSDGQGLRMVLRRWWLGPIPMPMALAPDCEAREWEEDGRFWFDVPVALPLIGPLVHYRGWLAPPD